MKKCSERLGGDFPAQDSAVEMAEIYGEVRTHLYEYMRPDARQAVADHFEEYLDNPRLHGHPLTLCHGDFGGSNILYN